MCHSCYPATCRIIVVSTMFRFRYLSLATFVILQPCDLSHNGGTNDVSVRYPNLTTCVTRAIMRHVAPGWIQRCFALVLTLNHACHSSNCIAIVRLVMLISHICSTHSTWPLPSLHAEASSKLSSVLAGSGFELQGGKMSSSSHGRHPSQQEPLEQQREPQEQQGNQQREPQKQQDHKKRKPQEQQRDPQEQQDQKKRRDLAVRMPRPDEHRYNSQGKGEFIAAMLREGKAKGDTEKDEQTETEDMTVRLPRPDEHRYTARTRANSSPPCFGRARGVPACRSRMPTTSAASSNRHCLGGSTCCIVHADCVQGLTRVRPASLRVRGALLCPS